MFKRKPGRQLSAEELKAKRKKDFWTLDLPLVFGLTLCTTFTIIEGVRGLDGNGRALAYAFQWPTIGAIIIWIWYRYKREGLRQARMTRSPATSRQKPKPHPRRSHARWALPITTRHGSRRRARSTQPPCTPPTRSIAHQPSLLPTKDSVNGRRMSLT
jgi:hypothetical protein